MEAKEPHVHRFVHGVAEPGDIVSFTG